MQIFLSNIQPCVTANSTLKSHFQEALQNADKISIASGYISTDALTELRKVVELNEGPRVDLLIGMHHFDGFTETQHQAVEYLNEYLTEQSRGRVNICTAFKFHGKVYAFEKAGEVYSATIGSSNISTIFDNARTYEVDLQTNDQVICSESRNLINNLLDNASVSFNNYTNPNIVAEKNKLLVEHDRVSEVGEATFEKLLVSNPKAQKYTIPIKSDVATKSNLNVYFGKGRVNQKGFIQPRHWYEAELIVPVDVTRVPGYPHNREFTVITDDGWEFKCKTSGQNSKNFRSEEDLKILGKWLKGRLEQSGALKVGEYVTSDVLAKYGRDNLELISTSMPDIWLLNFKR